MKNRSALNGVTVFVLLAGAFLMSGCGVKVHQHLDAQFHGQKYEVTVLSKIPHEEICIHIDEKRYVSDGGGLIPILIDKAINKTRASSCEQIVAPLLAATSDVDFRSQYWDALEKELAQSSWLRIKKLDKRSLGYDKEESGNMQTPLLIFNTVYELSTHSQVLLVQTKVNLYINDLSVPDYFGFYTYYSNKIGKNDEENEAAVALWMADNASKFRSALAEGIKHNMRMLRYDLLDKPATPEAEKDLKKVSFRLRGPLSGSKEELKGVEISRESEYLMMRETGGNLFTIALGLEI